MIVRRRGDIPTDRDFFGITQGKMSLVDVIARVAEGVPRCAVDVATWTVGMQALFMLNSLMTEGIISQFRLLIDRSYGSRHPKYASQLVSVLGTERIRVTSTHAKFVAAYNADTGAVVSTSMNLDTNRRYESFMVVRNRAMAVALGEFIDGFFAVPYTDFSDSSAAYSSFQKSEIEEPGDFFGIDTRMKEIDFQ